MGKIKLIKTCLRFINKKTKQVYVLYTLALDNLFSLQSLTTRGFSTKDGGFLHSEPGVYASGFSLRLNMIKNTFY